MIVDLKPIDYKRGRSFLIH